VADSRRREEKKEDAVFRWSRFREGEE